MFNMHSIKKVVLVSLSFLVSVIFIIWVVFVNSRVGGALDTRDNSAVPMASLNAHNHEATPVSSSYFDGVDPVFWSKLLDRIGSYRKQIDNVSVQASLVEVRDYVIYFYPSTGVLLFYRAVSIVFPEYSAEILNTIKRMDEYNRWFMANSQRLSLLKEIDSNREIWEKRVELFASDAEEIWSSSLTAYEQRRKDVRDAIEEISQSQTYSNEEKLYQLRESLTTNFNQAFEGLAVNKSLFASLYFNIDSVQKELIAMPAEEQQQLLNEIRRQMGYSQEQITKFQKMDIKRNKRWEKGTVYMLEREKLAKRFSGVELDANLDLLREKYFKHEAKTIALEEEESFYRFLRPRVIGRN
jgi:hypothetical protein